MIDPTTQRIAIGFKGFCWTCLFFGPLPALFRGHILGFLVMLAASVLTFYLSTLVFVFIYNSWHYNWLLGKGYRPAGMGYAMPQNVVNVSVGNVGTADHSRHAYFDGHGSPQATIVGADERQFPASPTQPMLPKR
jgi:hypothetical protein